MAIESKYLEELLGQLNTEEGSLDFGSIFHISNLITNFLKEQNLKPPSLEILSSAAAVGALCQIDDTKSRNLFVQSYLAQLLVLFRAVNIELGESGQDAENENTNEQHH